MKRGRNIFALCSLIFIIIYFIGNIIADEQNYNSISNSTTEYVASFITGTRLCVEKSNGTLPILKEWTVTNDGPGSCSGSPDGHRLSYWDNVLNSWVNNNSECLSVGFADDRRWAYISSITCKSRDSGEVSPLDTNLNVNQFTTGWNVYSVIGQRDICKSKDPSYSVLFFSDQTLNHGGINENSKCAGTIIVDGKSFHDNCEDINLLLCGNSSCVPKNCSELGKNCGTVDDTCGTNITCGLCSDNQTCTNNICVENCIPKTCSQLGKNCGTVDDTCGTNITCGSCFDNQTCTNNICINNVTGTLYWADMKQIPISTAQIKDTVLLIADITQVKDKEVNFTIYNQGELSWNPLDWFDKKVATLDNKGFTKWTTTTDGKYYFKVTLSTGETFSSESNTNGILTVTDTEDNSLPTTGIVKPEFDSSYIIDSSSGETNPIGFEQNSSDSDDDLSVTWGFGDNTNITINNCLSGVNCNTTHNYSNSGTKIFNIQAKEMTRDQTAMARSRLFVYKEGINIFAIIDNPSVNEIIRDPGVYYISGNSSHVADCSFDVAACESRAGMYSPARTCYTVTDRINSSLNITCYVLASSDDPNFKFLWAIDGSTSTEYPTTNAGFYEPLIGTKDHTIDLTVSYTKN